MAWRNRAAKWQYSSDEDRTHPKYACSKQNQTANSAEDAIWKAAKRVGSAVRWLKMDLMILAAANQHTELVACLEDSLRLMGHILLPELGASPLDAAVACRPEVIDLISILSSTCGKENMMLAGDGKMLKDSSSHLPSATDVGVQVNRTKDMCKASQTDGNSMVRVLNQFQSGKWIPLDQGNVRRGALVKSLKATATDNADMVNLSLREGMLGKIVDIDADGDLRLVLLSDMGVEHLHSASDKHWLLQHRFPCFETWIPDCACEDAARQKRNQRECSKVEVEPAENIFEEFVLN